MLVIRGTVGVRSDVPETTISTTEIWYLCTRVELKLLLPAVYYESVAKMSPVIQVHRFTPTTFFIVQSCYTRRDRAGFGIDWHWVILF